MKKFAKVCVLFISSSALYGMDDISRDHSELEKSLMQSEIDELRERLEMVEKHHEDIMNILRGQPELVVTREVLQVVPDEKRTPAQKQLIAFRTHNWDMDPNYILPDGGFNVAFYLARKEKEKQKKKESEEWSEESKRLRAAFSATKYKTNRSNKKKSQICSSDEQRKDN
jgi:hypothetical protein